MEQQQLLGGEARRPAMGAAASRDSRGVSASRVSGVGGALQGLSALLLALMVLSPLFALALALFPVVTIGSTALLGLALGVPLLAVGLALLPVPVANPGDPVKGGWGYTEVRGAVFGIPRNDYYRKLGNFYRAAERDADWRAGLMRWFADLTTGDPTVGDTLGSNSKMYFSHATCRRLLQELGPKLARGDAHRESELALGVFNNLPWPEAGRFQLGLELEEHALVRPYLARMFDPGAWTPEQVRSLWRGFFADTESFECYNQVSKRTTNDALNPRNNGDIVTQWVIKAIHVIGLGITITDQEAKELSTLQNTNLAAAAVTSRLARSLIFWSMITRPVRTTRAKYMPKYKAAILAKWPGEDWTERKLDLLASSFLDALLFAGGRSVPLVTDIVMGHILTRPSNQPEGIRGVDFAKEDNARALVMECVRLFAPVTTINFWERTGPGGAWEHHCPCLHKALYDPAVFPEPLEFRLHRPGLNPGYAGVRSNSIAWADYACVDGDQGHPDSHSCPAKDLSIQMVVAFALEFRAAGFVAVDDDIAINYYGTRGWAARRADRPLFNRLQN